MSTMHPLARRVIAPGFGLLAAVTLAACAPAVVTPTSSSDPSPSDVAALPSPEPTVVPLADIEQPPVGMCALNAGIVPSPDDPDAGPIAAVRVELLGQGSDDVAMAAVVGDDLVVTPSVEAGDPTGLVEAAIARLEDAGHPIEQDVVLGEPVDWMFDDLCAAMDLVLAASGSGDAPDVMSVGIDGDGRLAVGLLAGDPTTPVVADVEAAHPGMVRTYPDVQSFG